MSAFIRSGALVCALLGGTAAQAGPCDYRPSKMAKDASGPASQVASDTAKAVGKDAKAVGFYTLTGGATGGTMLGVAGAGGTGAMATAGAIATAPVTIIAGAAAAAGLAGYEGLCYFTDKRVTKYGEVLEVIRNLSLNADPDYLRLDEGTAGQEDALLTIRNSSGEMEQHAVRDLYIVNGVLMYRASGKDGVIGNVDFVARSPFPGGNGTPLNATKAADPTPVSPTAEVPTESGTDSPVPSATPVPVTDDPAPDATKTP